MQKAVVLGGGMIGSAIAVDLAHDFSVTVVDARETAVAAISRRAPVEGIRADLTDAKALGEIVGDADVVVGALPSALGFSTLRAMIVAGKNYCDISFMPEDAMELDALAHGQGVTCVVDCGVAPGISNMTAGYAYARLDPCESLEIYVGGLPEARRWPYEYKAGFAPRDVIEEYTRPARMVVNGRVVIKDALSEPELIDFPKVGMLEAFNTDGLRTLIATLPGVPFMKEKTMRYPGHIALMKVLRDTGFFSKEPIQVGGQEVVPLELTARLLFPKWTFAPGEADLTVMRVVARGMQDGVPTRYRWDLLDRYDAKTDMRSMSRTTAFPAAIMARMIAQDRLDCGPGVHPPEIPAQAPGILEAMLAELEKRGVHYDARVDTVDS